MRVGRATRPHPLLQSSTWLPCLRSVGGEQGSRAKREISNKESAGGKGEGYFGSLITVTLGEGVKSHVSSFTRLTHRFFFFFATLEPRVE